MAYVRAYVTIVVEDAQRKLHSVVGALGVPIVGPSITGTMYRTQASVAAGAKATLYTTDNLADFDLLVVTSTAAGVFVELTTDPDNSVGDEVFTVELAANVPLVLGSKRSYANYTADFGGGTIDAIQRVRVKNTGTTAATVELVAVT